MAEALSRPAPVVYVSVPQSCTNWNPPADVLSQCLNGLADVVLVLKCGEFLLKFFGMPSILRFERRVFAGKSRASTGFLRRNPEYG